MFLRRCKLVNYYFFGQVIVIAGYQLFYILYTLSLFYSTNVHSYSSITTHAQTHSITHPLAHPQLTITYQPS